MGMEVVFHVHLMSCAVKTQHPLFHIVLNVMNLGMDVGSVHQGIILMIQVVHVFNVMNTHVVQGTVTMNPVPQAVLNVQMTL